jgi:acyl-CoA thioester hydrolase
MGYVYYGNYASYFESGRIEALRVLGFSYKKMEDSGIMLPVLSLQIKYIRPAFFDDLLSVKTCIRELPSARIRFHYETFNEDNILLNTAETELVFISTHTRKPCAPPLDFMEALKLHF